MFGFWWRCRRPLEVRMLSARSRRRIQTRRIQRAHSVSRKGPRRMPPLLRYSYASTKRKRLEARLATARRNLHTGSCIADMPTQLLERATQNIAARAKCGSAIFAQLRITNTNRDKSPRFRRWPVTHRASHRYELQGTGESAQILVRQFRAVGTPTVDSRCSRVG